MATAGRRWNYSNTRPQWKPSGRTAGGAKSRRYLTSVSIDASAAPEVYAGYVLGTNKGWNSRPELLTMVSTDQKKWGLRKARRTLTEEFGRVVKDKRAVIEAYLPTA